mmetsp:Transcript_56519/g.168188  ORF Transcript_56519/g.168188 Transcript_56519/m.168188 type:complete len:175 (+) Transcript_56519:3-527(+)
MDLRAEEPLSARRSIHLSKGPRPAMALLPGGRLSCGPCLAILLLQALATANSAEDTVTVTAVELAEAAKNLESHEEDRVAEESQVTLLQTSIALSGTGRRPPAPAVAAAPPAHVSDAVKAAPPAAPGMDLLQRSNSSDSRATSCPNFPSCCGVRMYCNCQPGKLYSIPFCCKCI